MQRKGLSDQRESYNMPRLSMLPRTSRIVALCSAANFINAADRVIMPIAIVPMTDQYRWNLHWQGWILSAFAFGYFTSQVIGASTANRFGCKTVLMSAVLLWSISTVITPLLAHSIPMLIICRVILGLGEGLGLPVIFHLFAHNVPVEERSRAFGYLVAAGSVGQVVASVICPHMSWPNGFYLFGSLGILWTLLWMLLYRESNTQDEIPLFLPKVAQNRNMHWTELITHWPLWALYIAHFAMNWSNYIIMQWLPTYLARNLSAYKESISLTALPYIVNSLVGIVAGHSADNLIQKRWSVLSVRRLMTSIGLIGPGAFLLAFCAVDNLLAAVIFVSISMGLCACNSAGHLSNHADVAPNHAGITFAISNTIATIPGILCGPLTAELVTASQGRWMPVFVLAAAVNFTGAIIYHTHSSALQVL
ncbi:sodium-dependent phosphate transport protein 1, chloroplastic-like isoform X1 [Neodiprion fabricii]|uniref:sodium-dependent phosphate transport protein 1, chloroplastic-like isoform X1 n=2 Tax=Neodiprion fabricii TaxID=2872261 RepID=UPI001ED8FC3C|nr:sodium-dependent phosphate transport protein 1, chloroplastic-like isoform X1 [Neodiprion fabricii]XP_046416526.1 sodium-dependent phosphate transport protein 1, chloroplastic-like isoform X1 [Neodiprion fabricii]